MLFLRKNLFKGSSKGSLLFFSIKYFCYICKIIINYGGGEIKKIIAFFQERGNKRIVMYYKLKLQELRKDGSTNGKI